MLVGLFAFKEYDLADFFGWPTNASLKESGGFGRMAYFGTFVIRYTWE
ncbi:hypothetical protein [Spirosoma telluris]